MRQQLLVPLVEDVEDAALGLEQKLKIRAAANEWISVNFPKYRKFLSHSVPEFSSPDKTWEIAILTKNLSGDFTAIGQIVFDENARIAQAESPEKIQQTLLKLTEQKTVTNDFDVKLHGENFEFHHGDGITGAKLLRDKSIDLLLTDPPYGISKEYTCETQVPRRLRKDGTDFIMPKGNFGNWDGPISPAEWTLPILPKIKGWFVTFCAQAQIGEYCDILKNNKFVAVGTMVWQKTNPVPFNHKYKPINAWEALVIGKRPGTKFNGRVVHNVFLHKSPSPQQRIHSTQKPLELIKRFIELFSDEGDFIFDPFAGSATTLVAASAMRRKVLAYEKDALIYQAACGRITSGKG